MSSYCAFLGHQPQISTAELASIVPGFRITHQPKKDIILFDTDSEIDQKFGDTLGGTMLIAQHIRSTERLESVPQILLNEIGTPESKVTFSLRGQGIPHRQHRDLYKDCKKTLREAGYSSRYIGTERDPAPCIALHDEGIIAGAGCELVIVKNEYDWWIGRTVFAQDIKSYTKRDIHKPIRDTQVGLLPPKLAQVMINLGLGFCPQPPSPSPKGRRGVPSPYGGGLGWGQNTIIYDPFCGTGVIPLECLLRGFSVLASDISDKAVHDCQTNIEWLRKEWGIGSEVTSRVWKHDVREGFGFGLGLGNTKHPNPNPSPHLLITETTLGTPLTRKPTRDAAEKLRDENEQLQIAFLRNAKAAFPTAPIVCTLPVWQTTQGQVFLEKTWDELPTIGYQAVLPDGIEPAKINRPSLLYKRPDHIVARQIVTLQPM